MENMYRWICSICNKSFRVRSELRSHMKNETHYCQRKSIKGKTYEELFGVEKASLIKKKVSAGLQKVYADSSNQEMNKCRIEKIKKTAAERHSIGGLRKGSGRGKKGWYQGYFCDSSWELAWVIYSLDHDVKFERNRESFDYTYLGKVKRFYPDFLLEDGTLVEIKGFKTDEYRAKLESFPKDRKLITLYKNEMKVYLDYVMDKFGKDFTNVYENRT